MKEGFEKSVQEGRQEGIKIGEVKLVKMMLNNGTDLATICKLTGISIKELEKLISKF